MPPAANRLSNPPLACHLAAGRANEAAREAGGSRGEHRRAASQAGVGQDSDEGRGQAVHTGRQLAATGAVCPSAFVSLKEEMTFSEGHYCTYCIICSLEVVIHIYYSMK